jgi:hypothetical protein
MGGKSDMKVLYRSVTVTFVTGIVAASIGHAFAGPFDGLSGMIPGHSDQAPSGARSSKDLEGDLSELNRHFSKAMREMLIAQSYTIAALGDQVEADKLSSEANSLEGVNDINTVSRSITVSEDASKEIDSKMGASGEMDEKSKATLRLAVPHYGEGMIPALRLPNDYRVWITSAKATVSGMGNNPMGAIGGGARLARDVPDVVDVTAHLPDLISTWSDTTHNFVKFSHRNHVETGDLSSKI